MKYKLFLILVACILTISFILAIDSDLDGVDDEIDNCQNYSSGLATFCVINSSVNYCYNPDQRDADGDGLGNLCDPCPANWSNGANGCTLQATGKKWVNATNDAQVVNNFGPDSPGYLAMNITAGSMYNSTTISVSRRTNNLGNVKIASATISVLQGFYVMPNGTLFSSDVNITMSASTSSSTLCLNNVTGIYLQNRTGGWSRLPGLCMNLSFGVGTCRCSGVTRNLSIFTETLQNIVVNSPVNGTTYGQYVKINGTSTHDGIGVDNITSPGLTWIAEFNGTNMTINNSRTYPLNPGNYKMTLWQRGFYGSWSSNNTVNFTVSHTCVPPAINTDWNVYFNDNCTVLSDTNLGTGKLYVNGTAGTFTIAAALKIKGYGLTCSASGACKFATVNLSTAKLYLT